MKQERIRVTKMAGELINDFLTFLGCNNINLHICEDPDAFLIHITGVFQDLSEERLQRMKNLLCQPRNYELEEMYWSLSSERDTDAEIHLVGIMTDEVTISRDPEKKLLSIHLVRKK
jgi:hypothetical protein